MVAVKQNDVPGIRQRMFEKFNLRSDVGFTLVHATYAYLTRPLDHSSTPSWARASFRRPVQASNLMCGTGRCKFTLETYSNAIPWHPLALSIHYSTIASLRFAFMVIATMAMTESLINLEVRVRGNWPLRLRSNTYTMADSFSLDEVQDSRL